MDRIQHNNVQPRDMVCDDQASAFAVRGLFPFDQYADVEYGQQLPVPVFQRAVLSGLIKVRVNDRQQQSVNKVQTDAAAPEYAYRNIRRMLSHNRHAYSHAVLLPLGAVAGGAFQ